MLCRRPPQETDKTIFFLIKPIRRTNFRNLFRKKKLYMFRASTLPIIRSFLLYIRHWYISCRFDDSLQAESVSWLCLEAVIKPAWNIPVPNVQ